jgi:Carboxypeptidase regulatory-like domain
MKNAIKAAALLLMASACYAQFSSAIDGSVRDPSGAAVPDAKVTVVDEGTGFTYHAVSGTDGLFRVPALGEGTYRIDIQATGFVPFVQSGIRLQSNQIQTVNSVLQVGEQKQTIEVSGTLAAVEIGKSETGSEIENRTIESAPILGRNVYSSLILISPGITGNAESSGGTPTLGTDSFGTELQFNINAAGQREENNDYQLDGTSIVVSSRGGAVYVSPEPDTVESVKVQTADFSADKGRFSGALVQTFSKSGTNEFHGTLSEYHTDNDLRSRTIFQNSVPVFRRNEFGGTFGGPIIKNHTFFFGSLFYLKSSTANTTLATVETPQFANWAETNYPNNISSLVFKQAPPQSYPVSNFQTVAQVLAKNPSRYPLSLSALPLSMPAVGTAVISESLPRNGWQWNLRVDHDFNAGKDRLFYSTYNNLGQDAGLNVRPSLNVVNPERGMYNKLDWIHTISSSLLNDASMTYVRTSFTGHLNQPQIPNTSITGASGPSPGSANDWTHNDFSWHEVLSWIRGKHNLRFGGDVDRARDDDPFTSGYSRPTYNFANIVDFALDNPYEQVGPVVYTPTSTTAQGLTQRIRMLYSSIFVQDDYKISPRFTLNLGVRFEDFYHLGTVKDDRTPVPEFVLGPGSTVQQQLINGTMQVLGVNAAYINRNAIHNFAPRIGFGWDIFGDGKTALRGGYGIYYDKLGSLSWISRYNPPTWANPDINTNQAGITRSSIDYTLGPNFNPPAGVIFQPNAAGGFQNVRVTAQGVNPNMNVPTVQSWMLSLQRELFGGLVFEADYNGTHSENLYIITDQNRFAGDLVINNGKQTRLSQSFGAINLGRSDGLSDSAYGTIMVAKRFSGFYSLRGIFTFGKATDFDSSSNQGPANAFNILDAANPAGQKGRADFSVGKRLTIDSVLQVPTPWKQGLLHAVFGGWQMSNIAIFQAGLPFSVYTSAPYPTGDYNADGFNYDYPNTPAFGNSLSTSRSSFIRGVFPASAFPIPTPGQEGNLGRNTFTGPGLANINSSFSKAWAFPFFGNEAASIRLSADIFNLLNRVNLFNPTSDLSNPLFGHSTSQDTPREVQFGLKFSF